MNLKERIRKPISDKELNRRWTAIRSIMKEKDIDVLLTQGSNMHLGGYVRYLTDIPAEYNYYMTVLMPKNDDMTIIRTSDSRIPQWALRGVEDVLYAPMAPSLNYTSKMQADYAINYIKKHNFKKIGYAGRGLLTTGLITNIQSKLENIELVDITDEFDLVKSIKSEEEMILVRDTARLHDHIWSALPSIVKVGMTEYQIRAEVAQLSMNLGSEEQLLFIGTAEPGEPCGMPTHVYQNRRVKEGDYGVLLLEVSGPGGYYCESARNFCFGEPYKELADAWEVAVQAQKLTADLLVPGNCAVEIVEEYNDFVDSKGYCKEGRLYGHSQGYDLVERPAFMAHNENGDETMKICKDMNISLHPFLTDDKQTVYVNDNFYVTENGAERIHKTVQEIIIL
jgi:Xaa-Pro aminopeptidase